MTFSVNGRCHQVLRALVSMIEAGLVRRSGLLRIHQITSDGREALTDLDAGSPVHLEQPEPRITFTRRAGEVAKNPSPVAG